VEAGLVPVKAFDTTSEESVMNRRAKSNLMSITANRSFATLKMTKRINNQIKKILDINPKFINYKKSHYFADNFGC
jgi:hypothetical protein